MSKQLFWALSILYLSGLACARTSPSTPTPAVLPIGDSSHTLTVAGDERSYLLHVPPSYDATVATAVVLAFHGGGGNAANMAQMTAFSDQADQAGFLVVYPNGTGRLENKLLTWNGGTCCAYAQEQNVDDVAFVRAIVADLEKVTAVDPHRIYATGFSNGGILSYRLACEASDLFAAIASVSGTQNITPCTPAQPVAILHFHGTNDQNVPYNGGQGADSLTQTDFRSVQDTLAFWVAHNQCSETTQNEDFADIEHIVYTGCAQNGAVEAYTIVNGGHAWPGGNVPLRVGADQPTETIHATPLIWAFFATHPKP